MEHPNLASITNALRKRYPSSRVSFFWNLWGAQGPAHIAAQTAGVDSVIASVDVFHAKAIASKLHELGQPCSEKDVDAFITKQIRNLLLARTANNFSVTFNVVETPNVRHYTDLIEAASSPFGSFPIHTRGLSRPGSEYQNRVQNSELFISYNGKVRYS